MSAATLDPGQEPDLQDLLILCYHAVSPEWRSFLAVDPEQLRRQVDLLLGRGYAPMTLSDALASPGGRRLVVTFDDGYRSILARGLPVLAGLGVPATAFVQTDLADAAGRFAALPEEELPDDPAELECMSWEEVRELAATGWEIGSHTRTHPHLEQIPAAAAAEELQASRQRCEEELQAPCRTIAYPFGTYDRGVMELTEQAGYEAAVTLESRLLEPISGRTRFDLPREGVFNETGRAKFLANTSRLVRRVRLAPAYARVARGPLASSHR
ncbi:MAG TPA: polysaccharide deacetylase family protein [Solirubrobacterales bacterium]|nr:polysaccharide deacetylase family protein [Solirubrobacterales bacterium]